jgi:hypothetical protein
LSLPGAGRVLAVGIGGGGDVVGALAAAEHARTLGRDTVVGGLTWERRPIDPIPGPRRLDEITGAEILNEAVALAGPETAGPHGVLFGEAHMARHLGEPVVLVDPNPGPAKVAAGLADAARRLSCDTLLLLDVGGDVLAHGDEAGLASPLADSVLLACAAHLPADGPAAVLGVFGAGCDGELTPAEVLERFGEVAGRGGWLGTASVPPEAIGRLEAAIAEVPTEASAMALRCARGHTGRSTIRNGRRTVELSPVGALLFLLDPRIAMATAARLADAVVDAPEPAGRQRDPAPPRRTLRARLRDRHVARRAVTRGLARDRLPALQRRHDDADARAAAYVLRLLEETRARLSERFPTLPDDPVAVVLHGRWRSCTPPSRSSPSSCG